MKQILLALLILSGEFAFSQASYKTIDLSGQPLEGRGWHSALKNNYDRFPARAEQVVRKEVWDLSRNSAGLRVRFRTNSKELKFRYTLTGSRQMNHMPATGVSGLDLYARSGDGRWKWCGARFSFGDTVVYQYSNLNQEEDREYILYFPLYNHISWMELSYPDSSGFQFLDADKNKPIVIYGTSIAQGGCASRAGLSWTNILSRKLNRPIINLAFSGNGRMEPEVFRLISEIDAQMLVIDCLPNMGGEAYLKGELRKRLVEGISIMRSQKPGLPILLVDHCGYSDELTNDQKRNTYQAVNRIQHAVFDSLRKAGVKDLYYLTKKEIGLNIESTVDGIHPNDIGMMRYAEAYYRRIRKIGIR